MPGSGQPLQVWAAEKELLEVLGTLRSAGVRRGPTCQKHHGVEVQAIAHSARPRAIQPVRPHALNLQPALRQHEDGEASLGHHVLSQKMLQPASSACPQISRCRQCCDNVVHSLCGWRLELMMRQE